MDNQKAYLIGGLAMLVFFMGFFSHALYSNAITQAIEETRKEAALSAAQEIAKIEIKNTTIHAKLVERIRTETVYSECKHSPESYQLIKDAFK